MYLIVVSSESKKIQGVNTEGDQIVSHFRTGVDVDALFLSTLAADNDGPGCT